MPSFRLAPLLAVLSVSLLPVVTASAAPDQPAADTAPAEAPRYPFRGVLLGIFPEKATLLIQHEDVPGLMKGMKMAFRVADTSIFAHLKEHETITATLIVREDDFWLENIKVVPTKKK